MDTELDSLILDAIRHFGEATTGQIAAWIKAPTEAVTGALSGLLHTGRVDLIRDYWTVMPGQVGYRCWRCTLPGRYPADMEISGRQGHYIRAETAEMAAEVMAVRYPGERIAVQAWKAEDGRSVADTSLALTRAYDGAYYSYPKITRAEALALPVGTPVSGLAPIGIRWSATVAQRPDGTRYFKPAAGCPVGEFAPTAIRVNGTKREIV